MNQRLNFEDVNKVPLIATLMGISLLSNKPSIVADHSVSSADLHLAIVTDEYGGCIYGQGFSAAAA